MNDRQENLYAAPVSQTEVAPAPTPLYLHWSRRGVWRATAICAAVSGLFVLICRIFLRSLPPTYFSDAEWAVGCFGPVAISIAFVFGAPVWNKAFGRCGLRAIAFSIFVIAGLIYWNAWQQLVNNLALFLFCHFLLPAAICWIRRVPIRIERLLGIGIFSITSWIVLTLLTWLGLFSNEISDGWLIFYFQFPSLAVIWAFTASLTSAFMLEPVSHPTQRTE